MAHVLNNSKHLKMGFEQVTTVLNNSKCFECILTGCSKWFQMFEIGFKSGIYDLFLDGG